MFVVANIFVVAISRTGHAYIYGPFDNKALAYVWAEKNLPLWDELAAGFHDACGTYQVTSLLRTK